MKTICLFFQVHQPFRHKRYRFFDIGNDHYYYDDYTNETVMQRVAQNSYLETNRLLLKLADELEGKFKV
ncbi:MAG: alpha-amylase, partial [Prolixibacteraceae bacterium]